MKSVTGHFPAILRLALPMWIGELATVANPVLDTAMVARYSTIHLGALAVAAAVYISIFIALKGVMQSLAPTFSQLFGAGRFADMGKITWQGIWLGIFISVFGIIILWFPAPLLHFVAKAPPEVTEKAVSYLRILSLSLPAAICYFVYVTLNNALARPKMVMAIQVIGFFLKIPLNLLFIFGLFGLPEMGGPGCALATCIILWTEVVIACFIVRFNGAYRILKLFEPGIKSPRWPDLKELLAIGIPIGMNFFIEVTSFTFMALFISRLGVHDVAGHQIIANFSSLTYMLPLSLASATGTLVAHAIGAGNRKNAISIARSGVILSALLALVVASLVWTFQDFILWCYTSDPAVAAKASPLFLFLCSIFFFDAIQVATSHVLRAYKVVMTQTILYAVALWFVGQACGFICAFNLFPALIPARITGASGFWCCILLSIIILAAGLRIILYRTEKRVWRTPAGRAAAA